MPTYEATRTTPVVLETGMDLDEVLDIEFNWADGMTADSDTVSAAAWTIAPNNGGLVVADGVTGLTRDTHSVTPGAASVTSTTATAWIYATAVGTYTLECTILTASGRVHSRSARITVTHK